MIKGRYVATVTIDYNYPDDWTKGYSIDYSIDKLKKWLITDADANLRRIIEDKCSSDYDVVDVQRQYADLYHVPDETEDEHDYEHDQG